MSRDSFTFTSIIVSAVCDELPMLADGKLENISPWNSCGWNHVYWKYRRNLPKTRNAAGTFFNPCWFTYKCMMHQKGRSCLPVLQPNTLLFEFFRLLGYYAAYVDLKPTIQSALEDGSTCSPETSILNHLTLRDISEDGRIHFNLGGSFRARKFFIFGTFRWAVGTTTSACRCSRDCSRCCLVRVWVPCAAVLCLCVCGKVAFFFVTAVLFPVADSCNWTNS